MGNKSGAFKGFAKYKKRKEKGKKMKGKTVLVTGGAGFIGKNVTDELVKTGNRVVCYEKDQDITKPLRVTEHIDVVMHLAAIVGKGESEKKMVETNVLGTRNVLEWCKQQRTRMVFVSTCMVYGNPKRNPVDESTEVNPIDGYAKSKAVAEELCVKYAREKNVDCVIVRLFNPYGKGQKQPFLVPSIIDAMKGNTKLVLNAPELKRDYVHINDVVAALVKAGEKGKKADVINIGSGRGQTVQEVVAAVEKVAEQKINYVFTHNEVAVKEIWASIKKAKQVLGWEPKISFEEGIKMLVEEEKKA